MTLAQFLSEWIALRAPSLAPRTVECYQSLLRLHIAPTIGSVSLRSLSASSISSLLSSLLAAGHSRTAQLVYVLLRAALRSAAACGRLKRSPMDQMSPPRHRRSQPRWWSPDELRQFIAATKDSPYHVAWQLALCCGLRRGELAGLRWSDVDLRQGVLHIRNQRQPISGAGVIDAPPKSQSGIRDIPLPSALIELLNRHLATQAALSAINDKPKPRYVVSRDGSPINPHRLNHALAEDIALAGVRPINLHGLRHSMATLAVSLGVSMRVLQTLLGHSSYNTTANIYTHVLHTDQAAAMDKISRSMV